MVNVHSSGECSGWHRRLWSNFGSLGARRGCHSTLSFNYILSLFYNFFNLVRRFGGREEGATYTLASGKRGWPHPPKVNAARPAGQWQTLDLIFKAPRFDQSGKKEANARFEKVVLNGQVVQENLELRAPTGHAWRLSEVRRGPLLLQADHGPVAFRNIRVRPLE